jgi:hypothetical protein
MTLKKQEVAYEMYMYIVQWGGIKKERILAKKLQFTKFCEDCYLRSRFSPLTDNFI